MQPSDTRFAQRARTCAAATLTVALLLSVVPSAHAACVGDCGGTGAVTVDNLVMMVNIALGSTPVTACTAGDANGDGQITIDEIVAAVADAENGCPAETPTATPTSTPIPTFAAHSSVGQIYVTDAPANVALQLLDGGGAVVQTGTSDVNGSFIFRGVAVGDGYMVTTVDGAQSGPVQSLDPNNPPDQSFYAQPVDANYGYITTRDGTKLAIMVYLPGRIDEGPYPTLVEYSGYDEANPDGPQEDPFGVTLGRGVGYAVVAINMRGTGCSGGAFNYFETLQSTDGYDAVETIAAQPWVKNHAVGMVGLSYPGISQLFVAQTQPPHLAAITPLSVISSTVATLAPGGILNSGFALSWAQERDDNAKDARLDCGGQPCGQPWAGRLIAAGDEVCANNQKLRAQSVSSVQSIQDNYGSQAYDPAIIDPLTPAKFVNKINVPVFLAGAWQDEEVGGYFPTMLDSFTGTDKLHFTLVNGGHIDAADPPILTRWLEFLSFYVRREIPHLPDTASLIFGGLALEIFGVPHVAVEPDRFANFTSFDAALASFESEPRVRVLFDSGAVEACPGFPKQNCLGGPEPALERSYTQWPANGLQPTIWYFKDGGRLDSSVPSGDGADSYIYDPSRAQVTSCNNCGSDVWLAHPPWDWQPLPDGKAVAYATDPLPETLAMVGSGSIDLWLKSTASDTDLQVTLSEIRPDGQETYVQTGWLRASYRKTDDEASTILRPIHNGFAGDIAPLPPNEFVLARVELYPFGHVFRAGSRLRITVEAPGGDRPEWKFAALPTDGQVINTIGRSAAYPSRLVLPAVADASITAPLPPCPSLRGQPCRAYVETSNTPG